MEINFNSSYSFKSGYSAPVKTLFKLGTFGDKVTRGFYGERITPRNVSLEHLNPHSRGGKNIWSNLVLASKWKNHARGTQPLREIIKPKQAIAYLAQFRGIIVPGQFHGDAYIRMIKKTLKDMKIFLDSMEIERRVKDRPVTKKLGRACR